MMLCFLSGYADVVTFGRFGCMIATQTANLIFLGRSLGPSDSKASDSEQPALFINVILANLLGAVIYRLIKKCCLDYGSIIAGSILVGWSCLYEVAHNLRPID